MSAIGGIYSFNGAPINEQILVDLGNRLSGRGPDAGRQVRFTHIGMTYRALHTNEESRQETQPFISSSGHALAWDGRLDNREELITQLCAELHGDHTDAAIVMAAYIKWQLDFLPRIIGDFALSLWDPHTRLLLLARDPIGPRTLYYHANNGTIIWSTELRPLLNLTRITPEINDEYVADYVTRLPDPSQTPYKQIQAVPPGSTVRVLNGNLQVRRFWRFDPHTQIRYATDGEYEEHFSYLFRQAVQCRLRADKPVWAELSGGLDSSAIVCMAHDLIKNGQAKAPAMQSVSLVYDEASKSDEREFISYVETHIGRKSHYLREDDHRILQPPADDYAPIIPNPIANFAAYQTALDKAISNGGARVLLSGKGGDQLLNSSPDAATALADLLVHGKLSLLHNGFQEWSQSQGKAYATLLRETLREILARKPCGSHNDGLQSKKHNLLYDRKFTRRMKLPERRLGPDEAFEFRDPSARHQFIWFLRLVRELSAGYCQEFLNAEISYPLTHRPLVEFLQAIPFNQKVRPRETRSILRRALRDLLPSEIANRKGKTLNTDAALRAVAREGPRLQKLFSNASICAAGYVNPAELLSLLDRARQHSDPGSLSVVHLLQLEYWLRGLEGRVHNSTEN